MGHSSVSLDSVVMELRKKLEALEFENCVLRARIADIEDTEAAEGTTLAQDEEENVDGE